MSLLTGKTIADDFMVFQDLLGDYSDALMKIHDPSKCKGESLEQLQDKLFTSRRDLSQFVLEALSKK